VLCNLLSPVAQVLVLDQLRGSGERKHPRVAVDLEHGSAVWRMTLSMCS
jgi:hypothetical protein